MTMDPHPCPPPASQDLQGSTPPCSRHETKGHYPQNHAGERVFLSRLFTVTKKGLFKDRLIIDLCPQQIHQPQALQAHHCLPHPPTPVPRFLADLCRPIRSLLACSGPPLVPKVPLLPGRIGNALLQGDAIQSPHSSTGVHQANQSGGHLTNEQGGRCPLLLR